MHGVGPRRELVLLGTGTSYAPVSIIYIPVNAGIMRVMAESYGAIHLFKVLWLIEDQFANPRRGGGGDLPDPRDVTESSIVYSVSVSFLVKRRPRTTLKVSVKRTVITRSQMTLENRLMDSRTSCSLL